MIVPFLLAALLAAPMAQDEPKVIDLSQVVLATPLTEWPFDGTVMLLRRNGDYSIVKAEALRTAGLSGTISVPRAAVLVDSKEEGSFSSTYIDEKGVSRTVYIDCEKMTRVECFKKYQEMVALMESSYPPKKAKSEK